MQHAQHEWLEFFVMGETLVEGWLDNAVGFWSAGSGGKGFCLRALLANGT